MRVLDRTPECDLAVLDPIRLPDIIRNSRHKAASGVLTPDHLVASTIPAAHSHHACARAAGIELSDINWIDPAPGEGHIRLQLNETLIRAESHYEADLDFNELMGSYLETIKVGFHDFVAPELPQVAFGIDPRNANPVERGFIAWLGEQKLIERIPTVEVRLTGGFTVAGLAVGKVQVDDAPLHRELSQGFGR